jgi:Lrp/AsnC family leucine-responsive transcriptional regulator
MSNSLRRSKQKLRARFPDGKLLDATNWRLLEALQADARLSFHELGRRVGLTAPAVAERVRRLEQAGVITGYRAVVPRPRVGLPILAFIRLLGMNNERYYERMLAAVSAMPRVLEAHHVAGDDSFILKVAAADVQELEHVIAQLTRLGRSVTSIVLSTLLTREQVTSPGPIRTART